MIIKINYLFPPKKIDNETILDVISIACAQYIEDFLYSNTTRLAKERGWQEDTMIDFSKGWNQFERDNLNKC